MKLYIAFFATVSILFAQEGGKAKEINQPQKIDGAGYQHLELRSGNISEDEPTVSTINISDNVSEMGLSGGITAAHLVYSDHIIDDDSLGASAGDGDGIAEEDESIEMPVKLHNTGTSTATNVYAILRSNDSYITLRDTFETWPDIPPDSSEWCEYDFDFDVSSSIPTHNAYFILEIHSDQGVWSDTFVVTIYRRRPYLVQLTSGNVQYITDDQHFWYEQSYSYWEGVGVRPDSGSDWDLRLYEDSTFSELLRGSYYTINKVDFLVRDYNHVPYGMDGVFAYRYSRYGGAHVEYDDFIETLAPGLNELEWATRDVIEVFDVLLPAGDYRFILDVRNSGLDLGFAIFDSYSGPSNYVMSRSYAAASSDTAGLGGDEEFVVNLGQLDWFGVVVWSNNNNGGNYAIEIHTVGIEEDAGTPSTPPVLNMSVSSGAASFSDAVTLKLSLPYDTKASIDVFDASGRHVKTVASNRLLSSGSHNFEVSTKSFRSGVYIVRYADQKGTVKTAKFVVIRR